MYLSRRTCLTVSVCALLLQPPAAAAQPSPPAAATRHPLDPLTAAEIETAAKAIAAAPQFPEGGLFATLVMKEPAKRDVLAFTAGAPIARQAFAVVLDRRHNRTFEAVVDVNASRLVSWTERKGVQPAVLDAEYDVLVRLVKADPRWQAAMRKRGHSDFDKVQIDNWAVGQVAPQFQGKRLLRALSYFKGGPDQFLRPPHRRRRRAGGHECGEGRRVHRLRRRAAAAAEPGAGSEVHGHPHRAEGARHQSAGRPRASRSMASR
jgi:primary-amine oxidase